MRRRFELFALEAWEDAKGNVLQVDHGTVAVTHVEPDDRPLNAQLTFDEWMENELMWNHHMERADAYAEDDEDGLADSNQW